MSIDDQIYNINNIHTTLTISDTKQFLPTLQSHQTSNVVGKGQNPFPESSDKLFSKSWQIYITAASHCPPW